MKKLDTLKAKWSIAVASATTMLMTSPVFATTTSSSGSVDNPISKTANAANQLTANLRTFSIAAAVLAFVIIGIMFIMGEQMSKKAKSWMMYVIIGLFVIAGASAIVSYVNGLW